MSEWTGAGRLRGKIAVVTGASRGCGRGVARALGQAGVTVYVTGRSTREGVGTQERMETIEETAEMVTALGGVGIAVRVDHTVDSEVDAFFARVLSEQGRLDLLVGNAWGGYEKMDEFSGAFWEMPIENWDRMFRAGLRSHLVSARYAAPLMAAQKHGLIVLTTTGLREKYQGNLFYDVCKSAINRMAYGMSHDLRPDRVAVIALAPGWMRTERMEGLTEDELAKTESPEYTGRAIVALATDPSVLEKSGKLLDTADLAREYGFTDVDGRQVPPFREIFPGVL